ncbi:hypothetical protein [Streptomyces sp. NPDC059009]|uniref:hypothetical protein n=1 Tax=Streptomyces sp. NPDC059009 TaxID=3346694 RepID=UPI0036809DD9
MPSSSRSLSTAFSTALSVAALLMTAAIPASAASTGGTAPTPSDSKPSHRPPVLVDCLGHGQVRPGDHMLACGDGNNGLRGLRWADWTDRVAHGVGRQVANDCVPDCAEGHFHTFWVGVEAYRPVARKGKAPHFSRLKVVYLDKRPEGSGPSQTYPLTP